MAPLSGRATGPGWGRGLVNPREFEHPWLDCTGSCGGPEADKDPQAALGWSGSGGSGGCWGTQDTEVERMKCRGTTPLPWPRLLGRSDGSGNDSGGSRRSFGKTAWERRRCGLGFMWLWDIHGLQAEGRRCCLFWVGLTKFSNSWEGDWDPPRAELRGSSFGSIWCVRVCACA